MQQLTQLDTPVTSLIGITRELTSILNEEMDYMKNHRPSEIEKFQKRKNILTASYHKELNDIKLNGGLASAGNGEIVRSLKKESRIFQETLTTHNRIIKAKKNLSEKMIKDISEEVTNRKGSNNKYGPNAKMAQKSLEGRTTSLALNKTI